MRSRKWTPAYVGKGFNISPRAATDYDPALRSAWVGLWANWDWAGKIKRDIDLGVSLGGTIVRIIGGAQAVTDGHITADVYLSRFQQVLDYCAQLGIMYYPTGCDTRPWTPATLPAQQLHDLFIAQAAAMQTQPDAVFGFDLVNELAASFTTYGGTFDPVALRGLVGQWAAAIKAVAPSIDLTCSVVDPDYKHGYVHHPELTPFLDYFDFHPDGTVTAAAVLPWIARKPVVFGETGILRTDPARTTAYRAVKAAATGAGVSAVLHWDVASDNYGLFDAHGGNPEPKLAAAYASLPAAPRPW